MSITKRCMFLPPENGDQELPPFALWDQFDSFFVDQGFDETGQYYLLFQKDYFNPRFFLQAVYFDRELKVLNSIFIKMKFPDFQDEMTVSKLSFDKNGAQLVHVIQKYSKISEDNKIVKSIDLYYFYLYDLLGTKSDHDIVIEEDQKPNFSLRYSEEESYEEVKFDYGCRDRGVTTLVVYAFHRLPLHENNSLQRVDLFHSSNGKFLHSKKLLLDLSSLPIFHYSCPDIFLTRNNIYGCGYDDDVMKETYKALEFDLNGELLHLYETFAPHSSSILRDCRESIYFCLNTDSSPRDINRIVKFKNGHVITVAELKEDELMQRSSDNEYISADVPVKRYGRFLMCYVYKDDDYCCKYKFIDSRSHKTIMDYEIPENQIHDKVDLNWNEREFSYTYYEEGFHFKISRIKSRIDQRTLKHFARLAVLTSFSEEYLIQQNLPSTLFDYLGIDK